MTDAVVVLAFALSLQPSAAAPQVPPQPTTINATDPAAVAEWDRKISRLVRLGELRLRDEKPSEDGARADQWYVQVHKGVPVVGTEIWRERDGNTTVAIVGSIYPTVTVDVRPRLSREEARAVFIGLSKGSPGPSLDPALAILVHPDKMVLVYRARVLAGGELTLYSIDASSGEVVASEADPGPPQ